MSGWSLSAQPRGRVLLRTRDVAIALHAAGTYQTPLGKVQLQKFIYLLDALSGLFAVLPVRGGYRTYKYGPWDPSIQNAVDTLAFRGLVKVVDTHQLSAGEVSARYKLTGAGNRFVHQLIRHHAFEQRSSVANKVAYRVAQLGWERLRELVYAEPTYVAARSEGFGCELAPADAFEASTRALIGVIREAIELQWSNFELDEVTIIDVFFRFLDYYARPDQRSAGQPSWT